MRIGQLAHAGGVNVETVRYYQRIGLLAVPERPLRGARRYVQADLERLRFVRRAQLLGFTLDDIAGLLRLSSQDCRDVQAAAERKLALVHRKLDDLARVERALAEVLQRCRTRAVNDDCPVIAALGGAEDAQRSGFLCVMGQLPPLRSDSRAVTGAKSLVSARTTTPGKPGKENR